MTSDESESLKALIADDEDGLRDILKEILEGCGFACTLAADGRHAFKELRGKKFDLMTLDINMPIWDGVKAVEAANILKPVPNVLCISGYITDEAKESFAEQKVNIQYIDKPFEAAQIKRALKAFFPELDVSCE